MKIIVNKKLANKVCKNKVLSLFVVAIQLDHIALWNPPRMWFNKILANPITLCIQIISTLKPMKKASQTNKK
jgi:hypothetical protein